MTIQQEPFTLEAQAPPRYCGDCAWYEPYRDEYTGRVHPSKLGMCRWPSPPLPMCAGMCSVPKGNVWETRPADGCACFKKK